MAMWWTVYDAGTDNVLACGRTSECAKAMGKNEGNFVSMISKVRNGKVRCYVIVREDLETGEIVTYGAENAGRPRKGFCRMDKEDLKTVKMLWEHGFDDHRIAERVGTSAAAIHKFRERNGLPANVYRKKERTVAEA